MSYLGQQLGQGQAERWVCTATAGQTSVTVGDDGRSIAYTPQQVDVYLNGAKQVNGSDVTVSSGTAIVFASGLIAGDVVDVVALSTFNAADTVSKTLGGTFTGAVNFPSGGLNVGSGQLRVDGSGRVLMPNQPAFTAYRLGGNISGVIDPVIFDSTHVNTGGCYSTSTGRFTAPVAGQYYFFATVDPLTSGGVSTQFKKNGVNVTNIRAYAVAVDGTQATACVLSLAAGDYVTVMTNTGIESSLAHFTGFMFG